MWATNRLYLLAGVRVQIRCTTADLGARVDALLGYHALLDEDPAASDLCYNLVAGKEPLRRGQRGYHLLYKEIARIARTTVTRDLLNALLENIVATLPHLEPDVYALRVGAVTHGDDVALLVGADDAATRRLVAALCARGYGYASGALAFVELARGAVSALALPLIAANAEEARSFAASGLSLPAALDDAYPLAFDLAACSRSVDRQRAESGGLEVHAPEDGGNTASPGRRVEWPVERVRAVVVEKAMDTAGSVDAARSVTPFSRARALLRLLARSANFNGRASERPVLLQRLLAQATPIQSYRVPDTAVQGEIDDSVAAMMRRVMI